MKTVLVTGSNGLLGQKLTDLYLKKQGLRLVATGKGPNRHPNAAMMNYRQMDITNREEVLQVIQEEKPHCIIHTAAMTNVDACELDHAACDLQNVEAVKYIVEAANAVNAHLVHLSTDFIFDGTHGPLTEEEEPKPLSYYRNSKLKGEAWVMQHAQQWAIARTVLVFGIVADMSRSNIVLWVKKSLEEGKTIHVVNDQFRTPTLAEDLAVGCALLEEKAARGIYNISGGDFMSIFELANRVAAFWKLDASLIHPSDSSTLNQPAKRPPITGFILDKAKRELGYQPHTFEAGLAILQQQMT